jgi:tetratricopeptide (TPR) repeat protein
LILLEICLSISKNDILRNEYLLQMNTFKLFPLVLAVFFAVFQNITLANEEINIEETRERNFEIEEKDVFLQMLETEQEERRMLERKLEEVEQQLNDYKSTESERELRLSEYVVNHSDYLLSWFLAILAIVGVVAGILGFRTKRDIEKAGEKMAQEAIQKIEGKYEQRFQKIEDEVKESAEDADIAIRQTVAQSYVRQGEKERAIDEYEDLENKYPTNPSVQFLKGNTFDELKKHEEAIACFDKAIELDPKDASAYINKGVALGNLKKYEEAIACYDKAIGLDQKNVNAYINKGNALDES